MQFQVISVISIHRSPNRNLYAMISFLRVESTATIQLFERKRRHF